MKATFYLKSGNKFTIKLKALSFEKNQLSKTLNWSHTLPNRLFIIDQDSIETITIKYSLLEIAKSWFKKG